MTRLPVTVLISGGGTTLENLQRRQQAGTLPVDFRLVISSNPRSRGLQLADSAGIPTAVLAKKQFDSPEEHRDAVFDHVRKSGSELVIMGGYLQHLLIPEDFMFRVVNIHPALIPAFAGHGYYGLRVHQAVLDAGVKLSGCTTHFVDNQFDHGPIIAQRSCKVLDEDTPESLQRRVFQLECELYPDTIGAIARGEVRVQDNRVLSGNL